MVRKYKLLLKMQLYSLFSLNRLLHSHDNKVKKQFIAIGAAGITIIGLLLYLSGYMSVIFVKAGLIQALPTMMMVVYSLIVLFLTYLKSSGALIGLKDYDMVMSLPVSSMAVVLSRLTILYLINLIIGMIALIPAIVVYGIDQQPAMEDYFILVISLLLTPIIPMITALIFGVIILVFSSRSKYNNILALISSIVGILLLIFTVSRMQNMEQTQVINISSAIINYIDQFYAPAHLFSKALLNNDWYSLGIFSLLSALLGIGFVIVIAYFYKSLNTTAFSQHVNKDFRLGQLGVSSPFMALYKKELMRLFSCTIYALNSLILIILLLVISFMSVFYLPDILIQQLEAEGIMQILKTAIPLVVAVFVCTNCTTSASLSLEGKSRWIICSMPVKASLIFRAKICVNLTVLLPFLWISLIMIRIAFALSLFQTILLFLTPTVYAFYISVMGMFFNLKFPKYDWTSEYYAVKGGAISVLITVVVGMVSSVLPLYICALYKDYTQIIVITATILIATVTMIIYKYLNIVKFYM